VGQPALGGIVELIVRRLPGGISVRAGDSGDSVVGTALAAHGFDVVARAGTDAVLLVNDELSGAGDHAEAVLAAAVHDVRPGGWLVIGVDNALRPADEPSPERRAWVPGEIGRLLGSRGVRLQELWAPGAGARLSGAPPRLHPELDREPSLLGAGDQLVGIGRTPIDGSQRSSVFFATLPRKTVAAATLTRHPDGRILLVHDAFKSHWTIPGGVVDADEDPESAAVRETREETGLHVRCTGLLGVFHARFPDRLVFVFGAEPTGGRRPAPVHTHEIDDARWVSVEEAQRRAAGHVAEQIRLSVERSVGVWRQ
jgi:ADP-ribose pyrophosphatase YjhB (NUDIX family)